MGNLPGPEFHFWRSSFLLSGGGWGTILSFQTWVTSLVQNLIFGNEVFLLSEGGWGIVGARVRD